MSRTHIFLGPAFLYLPFPKLCIDCTVAANMSPKNIKKLTEKKHREETGLFLVEGDKNIRELLGSDFMITDLLGTKAFLNIVSAEIDSYTARTGVAFPYRETDEETLAKTGSLLSNNAGIAVVRQRTNMSLETVFAAAEKNIVVLLDDIRDPGNMGSIIRTADWYGVTHIIASPSTTDFYNSKVISASMGSFTRSNVIYSELEAILQEAQNRGLPVMVADLQGESTHSVKLPRNGFLLMGSESHGVSDASRAYATHLVMIPRFGNAESLNVSAATAILLDSIKRST